METAITYFEEGAEVEQWVPALALKVSGQEVGQSRLLPQQYPAQLLILEELGPVRSQSGGGSVEADCAKSLYLERGQSHAFRPVALNSRNNRKKLVILQLPTAGSIHDWRNCGVNRLQRAIFG
jgi:hypothetical protein